MLDLPVWVLQKPENAFHVQGLEVQQYPPNLYFGVFQVHFTAMIVSPGSVLNCSL